MFSVVSDHRPHEFLSPVKLIFHLIISQSGKRASERCELKLMCIILANGIRYRVKISLEDQIVHIGERGPNAFEQEVDRLDGDHIALFRLISVGAQRQT